MTSSELLFWIIALIAIAVIVLAITRPLTQPY